ncbi:unnamed protein product [Peronospora farinosa]|uniref:Uncharacterized protein n=1 Tax=Peronospora farinosa TaxID=134698 RepID=A0ABN8CB13_9STRA|nr:unnamed protein product [Peronospora farinosa]
MIRRQTLQDRQRDDYFFDDDDDEEDDDDDEEEVDEDTTEDYVDQVEMTEENLSEEDDNRRRSGRKRKSVQLDNNLSDEDFILSSDEEVGEKSKSKSISKKKETVKSKTKSKQKQTDLSDESSGDNNVKKAMMDGFVIEKVLGREVHTLKEWKKICWKKDTRFLTHCSIFMPAEEEEELQEQEQKELQHGEFTATGSNETPSTKEANINDNKIEDAGEERFLIKWKTLSYLHTSWQTEDELMETDKNAKGKIQRFREKEQRAFYAQDIQGDEYFNPEFRSVDRILEISDRPLDDFLPDDDINGESGFQYFLVKWKALPYDMITWEREDDVGDDAAVGLYNDRILRAAKRYKKVALAKHAPQNKHKNFRGYTAESPPPCKKEQHFQLRDYQLTGVNWMLFNWYQKRNSMLADEMGLGKTVQTVMYVNHLAVVEGTPRPFIIVAPLSTLGHWQREFDSWTNLNAVVYHGSAAAREVLQDYEFFLSEDELQRAEKLSGKKTANSNGKRPLRPKRNCYRFDVLITTFEMASATDLYKLAQIDWQLLVVDEAHRLKNRNSKLSNILHTRFTYQNMLLLTGTPLQNNVEELWVLLNFLDTKKFKSKEEFLERFGELTDSAQVERLHSELKPYLLRRMKEDVEKSLAPKEETIIEVELTVLQKQYYRAIYEKNTEFLTRGGRKGDIPSLMNVLMELRKCCNHPFLVKGVEEREVKRLAKQVSESKEEIQRQISESLVDTSGKLVLLDKLLPRLKETGHRVLIFSQFKMMLDIIQDYLALRRYNCERIDGNITGNDRQSAIDRFCREDSNAFIMLLSTRAGGVGINLTAADTVIIYDSDWNPQNDLQAQARCHRIGQTKSVKIYRLLTSKTYELHMFHKASLKLGLDQAVLGGIKNDDPVAKLKGVVNTNKTNDRMSKEEIESLLKHGAYEMFKEQESDAEEASKKFGEESIDQILSRSTTIVHDPTRDADGNEKKNIMSSFSKATFVSSANPDEEVDVDDPNFWTKVVGLKGVEEHKKEEPSPLQARRCRRKVKSYLIDDDKADMMEDSGDETPSSRKKLFRGLGAQNDEEFVISDNDGEDEDEDEDDLSDVALAKDESIGALSNGKRMRTNEPVLPIYSHTERIVDLLESFGYGRWNDMKRCAPLLHRYPDSMLIKFVQDYVLSLVRATTAMTVFPRIGLDLEPSRVYIVSPTAPSPHMGIAAPIERYAHELTNSCRRYRFLSAILNDMRVASPLAVAIPPRMWITDFKSRATRGSRTKLQQIDTMYKLNEFVSVTLVPMLPLVALIKDLQRVGDASEVHRMIESGNVPETSDATPVSKIEESAPEGMKPTDTVSVSNTNGIEDTNKNDNVSSQQHFSPTDEIQEVVLAKSETNAQLKSMKLSLTEPTLSASSDSAVSGKAEPEASSASTAATEVATSEASSGTVTTNILGSSGKEGESESINSPIPSVSNNHNGASGEDSEVFKTEDKPQTSAQGSSVVAASAVAIKLQEDSTTARAEAERKQAIRILRALTPVTSPEAVAPWWIPRVDDVLLMMHVYCHGWMKGRSLPIRMVEGSTLFGDRAKRVPLSEWPSVAIFNRRLKVILQVWTAVKKAKPVAPPLTPTTAATGVTIAQQPRMQTFQHEQLQLQLQRQQQEQQRAQQARQYTTSSLHGSRHNQFAKLIFSYGIPDVSTCRDDRERNEKWRYFLQDSHLDIGRFPLEELLAEALDLERVCRQRLHSNTDETGTVYSEENSILGGKRGFWLLTTTQCRRLLHRVDLFRLLRSQILVLPPAQLVELVSRVVQAQAASTDYPVWWSCPRHDILLLQGVECYGLDEHLTSVWKLPLFSSVNTTSAFPSSSWVENYVTALGLACQNLIVKARLYHPDDGYVNLNNGEMRSPSDRYSAQTDPTEEAEMRQRAREFCMMREEDPYFVPAVRLRQLIDTNAARDKASISMKDLLSAQPVVQAGQHVSTPANDTVRVQTFWDAQTKRDENEVARKSSSGSRDDGEKSDVKDEEEQAKASGCSDQKEEKALPAFNASVIHLDDDISNGVREEETKSALPQALQDNSSVLRPTDATAALTANRTRLARGEKEGSEAAVKTGGKQSTASSWEVIVIDSSDDSD